MGRQVPQRVGHQMHLDGALQRRPGIEQETNVEPDPDQLQCLQVLVKSEFEFRFEVVARARVFASLTMVTL